MQQRLRLRRSQDFSRLRREGKGYHDRLMILSIAPNTLPHNRYGFIASRALGNAVKRNRARRQLREAVRTLHPRLEPGYDVVLIGKKSLVGQPFSRIVQTLEQLVRQADLIAEGSHQ